MLLVLLLVTSCAAVPQNLSEKMFTFPQKTSTSYVKLTTSRQELKAVTVCFRFFSDISRDQSIFSLATPSGDNGFTIFKYDALDLFQLWVKNQKTFFWGQDYKLNMWHSVCVTWDSASGLGQMWLNGKPSSPKFITDGSISGPIIIILGQDQDVYGGGFDFAQSFVGMLSEVHMWNYTLSPCQIESYMDNLNFSKGNVLNWNALEFQIEGRVLIMNKQKPCLSRNGT